MSCNSKILQSIINSCHPIKGVEPVMYWDYRSNLSFTFVDNTITTITAPPLGRIEVKKFGINAGHDVVVIENQNNRFKHKIDTVLNDSSEVIDNMDDIVVFVKENNATSWKVYGAEFGLWKESQAQMQNDNLATIAVSFASREGMEEEFESYNTSIDIAAIPNMSNFDLIYGGTIANGGAVKLTIDSDKTGYIKLPNGKLLTTVAGVIDTTYTGVGGAITYYVPKVLTTQINVIRQSITGDIVYNGIEDLYIYETFITSLTSNDNNIVDAAYNLNLTTVKATKAFVVTLNQCALTAKSIGDILYQAYIDNREYVVYNFSGGTNAPYGDSLTGIYKYVLDTYGINLDDLTSVLSDLGGTFTFNEE